MVLILCGYQSNQTLLFGSFSEPGDFSACKFNDPGLLGWRRGLTSILELWLVWDGGKSSLLSRVIKEAPFFIFLFEMF